MSKLKLKGILTLVYSTTIAILLCLAVFLISQKISFNFKETFFLLGLVSVLVGIVIVIAKNPNRVAASDRTETKSDTDETADDEPNLLLLGFNSFTIVFTGVILLVIDAILK